jgi:hypothetical protein
MVSRRKYRLCRSWWDRGEPLGVFSIGRGGVRAGDGWELSLIAPKLLLVRDRRKLVSITVSVSLSDAVEPSVADGVEGTVFAQLLEFGHDDRRMGTRWARGLRWP